MEEFKHTTVLLHEAIAGLNVKATGIYVDCTLGAGGHTSLLLQGLSTGHLYSFDQDQTAITYNLERFKDSTAAKKVTFIKANFRELQLKLQENGVNQVDGIVYDLGVSSPQFDDAERGFSYRYDAPLDMRMDQSQQLTARVIVNEWPYADLVRIFFRYGEEKYAKSIARLIEKRRLTQEIVTTGELVTLIKEAIPARARRTGGHPAKRVFQAIRIAVNDELGALEASLEQALELLQVGGRISVITFQSLEDRLVKSLFREKSSLPELPPGLPVIPTEYQPKYRLVTHKPIVPSERELLENHRAHSAKLRIIERIKE
ncbi:16S rRNA (cytosine(1402)-N(4))-methyltransferase RsmH [Liquorilactobacillus satsumensis]|uniref:Ribosomal RNA small subunit methyltransferase H n=1 Tax=Liquorilactobacillus satsumensis DSM 16230 = JCM 12392 TaxID=1423801 RepID=A0A0R1V2Q1_9LACO|nr:16S rRNA (cytosine(1402)-N(4))-methyltransferase RsmH [Liquorilactobacillus satsumensis]KRL99913.1 16S rRNA methyltransferase [Liquorilactobacillus satsumensis DSM 16230 = JCM 12392]MCC7665595.1 16S rRNA (cytosine(1402)-N(4))-methyltransferase RsmH [Liquorilactobacillus satsumensis]MCP9311807.1 16S rRNA (cytosine(1402)-N(4))-methyltransferase RsmH [Liquorilactobacillus satsumensis]MCP9328393.1 16S rRNA (cytosine(1402)-N(4))-methyltransferase RsmH [Liquorilactobacillus satsumensis]MCP9357353